MKLGDLVRVFGVLARIRALGGSGAVGIGHLGVALMATAIGAVLIPGRDEPMRGPAGGAFSATDSIALYGPQTFTTPTGAPTTSLERFTMVVTPGRQYVLEVVNGALDGTGRATGGSVLLNGSVVLSPADLAAGGAGWTRVVQPIAEDTLVVTIEGPAGANLTVSLLSTADPSVFLLGPERFIRNSGTPVTDIRTFTVDSLVGAPFYLCIVNGNTDGTNRLSSASIVLNGVEILTQSDLNQQVASLMRPITPQIGTNTLSIQLAAKPNGFLDLCVTGTDRAPPVVTISTPAPNTITNQLDVLVTGTVQDQTPTTVTVNGVLAALDGLGGYSATVPLTAEGENSLAVSAVDAAGNRTDSTRTIVRDTEPPVLTVTSPVGGTSTNQPTASIAGTVLDATPVTVNVNGVPFGVDGANSFGGTLTLSEGTNIITTTAVDAAGNSVSDVRTVLLDTTPPALLVNTPSDGDTTTVETATVSGTVTDDSPLTLTVNGIAVLLGTGGAFTTDVSLVEGPNLITVTATDEATNAATVVRTVVLHSGPALPPDPAIVAPALNRAEITTVDEATSFLYAGPTPIQTGVAPGTIVPQRAAVVRGRVLTTEFQPLSGVTVRIAGHPELGQTLSRADGAYDLAVNGGGTVRVGFERAGYFPAERAADVPWQDYVTLEDVILLQPDTAVTVVNLTSPAPPVARGSVTTDADGPRQATLIFKPGTQATLTRTDGTSEPLTTLTIRATEFTVGDSGRLAMPAPLPPASQYTYAVQLSADEQLAAGPGAQVVLSQPVPLYVDNFLSFPVGTAVPVGELDLDEGAWVPANNGVVLRVLGADGEGRALVDTDGDGVADLPDALLALGIDDFELVSCNSD